MKIFVLNCGSSSLKYKLFNMEDESVLADGKVERIGQENAIVTHQSTGKEKVSKTMPIYEHTVAIQECLNLLTDSEVGIIKSTKEIDAVGHRVVHGGESFSESVRITENTKEILESVSDLAPLHNPANLVGIRAAEKLMPDTVQVAVFDTAFHSTMPRHAFLYAIPFSLYQRHKVRRYGFHGTSHNYIAQRVGALMKQDLGKLKIISCHLGNGASLCAIDGGKSVDTSMGFTPLEGLMMGTRSGDINPGALSYIMEKENIPMANINSMLNKHSGLYGIAGASDMRDIEKGVEENSTMHQVAFDMYEYRIRKYIGSYVAAMNGVDAIAFTAGIGENSPKLRSAICKNLTYLGIEIDEDANKQRGQEIEISTPKSKVKVFVIPTDEEVMIARDTLAIVQNK